MVKKNNKSTERRARLGGHIAGSRSETQNLILAGHLYTDQSQLFATVLIVSTSSFVAIIFVFRFVAITFAFSFCFNLHTK